MTIGDDDPRGVANLAPRGMIGRIYVESQLTKNVSATFLFGCTGVWLEPNVA